MTLYVGETTRIQTTATDFEGAPLTNLNVTQALVTIWRKSDNVIVLNAANMTYDSDTGAWHYDWQTGATPQSAGSYLAKCFLAGVDFETWEYKTFRLVANPV